MHMEPASCSTATESEIRCPNGKKKKTCHCLERRAVLADDALTDRPAPLPTLIEHLPSPRSSGQFLGFNFVPRNQLWRKLKGLRDGDQRAGIGAAPPSVALAGLPGSPWIRLGPTSTRLLRTPFLPPPAASSSLPLLPDSTAEFGLQVPQTSFLRLRWRRSFFSKSNLSSLLFFFFGQTRALHPDVFLHLHRRRSRAFILCRAFVFAFPPLQAPAWRFRRRCCHLFLKDGCNSVDPSCGLRKHLTRPCQQAHYLHVTYRPATSLKDSKQPQQCCFPAGPERRARFSC